MSEIYYINKNTLTNIADAIRAATGDTEAIEVGKLGQRTSEAFVQKEEERDDFWITQNISGNYENNRVKTIKDYTFANSISLNNVAFPLCEIIGKGAFNGCQSLTTVSFPSCKSIGSNVFGNCYELAEIFFPICENIGSYAFQNCSKLSTASFSLCSNINSYTFAGCQNLTTVFFPICLSLKSFCFMSCYNLSTLSLPACKNIWGSAFYNCRTLSSLILGASMVCSLSNSSVFKLTPYAGFSSYFSGTPYIYVPSSLIGSYRTATNWTYFSSYFKAIGTENEINFTFDGVTYTAINGMTWAEWCVSEYDTAGLTAPDYVRYDASHGVATAEGVLVLPSDLIIADHNYIKGTGNLGPT